MWISELGESNIKDLLEDFGLEDTNDNRLLIADSYLLSEVKIKLFYFLTRYPALHYIDKDNYTLQPLELEEPPRTLLELDPNAYGKFKHLKIKYEFLVILKGQIKDPKHIRQFCFDTVWLKDTAECFNTFESIDKIDDDFWFSKYGLSMPLGWYFYIKHKLPVLL